MLSIDFIRENPQAVQENAKKKGFTVDIASLIQIDDRRRALIKQAEELRAGQNKLSKGIKGKPTTDQIERGKALKNELEGLTGQLAQTETDYKKAMLTVPNMLHSSVPIAGDESGNKVVKTFGQKPQFDFEAKDHEKLGIDKGFLDLETAAYTSGSRFYYLKNSAVTLEFALYSWLIDKFVKKGFTPVITPVLVREHMLEATGFFPAEASEIYKVNPGEDDLFLIGTSEVTLAGLHMQKPLEEADLPRRYVGFSSCFRREAGSYGKDTKGIFRVHQFDKLEMYSYAHPDDSWQEHEFLLSIEEEILHDLELHYQVVNICSGDLGAPAAKKYDCEVWLPSQQRYRELTSCSNTTDYQSRRGGIKYRTKDGRLELAHTLNGTAMAYSRSLIAIVENYQTAEGDITIPKVLRPYMNNREVL